MTMILVRAILALTLVAAPSAALAQNPNPLTANAKVQFGALSGFVVRSAEKVPEGLYNFRPVAEVRTMSELFGHVADAMFFMCSTAAGTKPPRTGIEKETAKPLLVAALKEGVSYCNSVYDGMTDQKGAETVAFVFGPNTPRLSVLYFVVSHTYEHYGNLVTYMRLNKIVPPSSEPPAKPQ
jgi:uncharacterized damage-inducible protein DinB